MNSLKDLLKNKADDIDSSGQRDDLQLVQMELDRLFEGAVKVAKFNDGVATVTTSNASMASELRMQQAQLIEDLNSSLKNDINRMIIRIA